MSLGWDIEEQQLHVYAIKKLQNKPIMWRNQLIKESKALYSTQMLHFFQSRVHFHQMALYANSNGMF